MSRRARALAFAAAAAVCAGLAAIATGGARPGAGAELGELRQVVVATEALRQGARLHSPTLREALELRTVPERFVPPDALGDPAQALGRVPVALIPPGSYLLDSQLRAPGGERAGPPQDLRSGRRAVEIAVDAAGALAAVPVDGRGKVDVIVTTEPGPGGDGRTYVAAEGVVLLGLRAAGGQPGTDLVPGPATGSWTATLALTRRQALRLIQAESFARSVRLIER